MAHEIVHFVGGKHAASDVAGGVKLGMAGVSWPFSDENAAGFVIPTMA